MRHPLLFLQLIGTLLGASTAQGQGSGPATVRVNVAWGGVLEVPGPAREGVTKARVPAFRGAYWSADGKELLLDQRIAGAVALGELQNPVYLPFNETEAKALTAYPLPASPRLRLAQGTERKLPVTLLTLAPWRRNPQTAQPEKLVSFDYQYELQPPTARRGAVGRAHAAHSVLASGDWFKLGVPENGIYKLDKATLTSLGINLTTLDPSRLQFFGNSTGILPQPNADYRPDDLVENNIQFVGNGNSQFEDGEYFLFYSPGPHTWEAKGGQFRHRNNIYSDTAYYFLTVGNTPGRRVPVAPAPAVGNAATISTFTDRRFYEHDLVNILHSGRQWLGEGFNTSSAPKDIAFGGLTGLVPNSPVRITTALAANAAATSTFAVSLNGAVVGNQSIGAHSGASFTADVYVTTLTHQAQLPAAPGPDLQVSLAFANAGDGAAQGYLDYVEINAERQLTFNGPAMAFRSFENIGPGLASRFALGNAGSGVAVWDVTNPRRPVAQALDGSGAFVALTDSLREYVALQPAASFPAPRPFGRVLNQDLHALDGNMDLIIVTYPPFRGEAERLANHRRSHDNLRVAVVTTTEVYNEFSSGGQDVTAIRDLMKQVYDRATPGKYQSVLLFGDASFDYKSSPWNDKSQEPAWWAQRVPFRGDADFDRANQNLVPTYESRQSFVPFYQTPDDGGGVTYSSEDYYGLLDDYEGEWKEVNIGADSLYLLDIGVGRLPVRAPKGSPRDATQARQTVDKIIGYDNPSSYGKWRNRITLSADDGENNYFTDTSSGGEKYASQIQQNHPAYNVHKTYLDMYPQVSVAAGQRSPAANQAIDESFEKGTLLWNYLGHGGPKGLADEQILSNASVLAFRNLSNLPFMITGTCDLSTYDNPDFVSAGEQVLVDNGSGGAVGMFTTTRVVDAGANSVLVGAFFDEVLNPLPGGEMPRIGDIISRSKNQSASSLNNRNYTLLGDPSMRLAYPEQTVVIDRINNHPVGGAPDTLHALSRVQLHGQVRRGTALDASFTGQAFVTIYDKPTTVHTFGDESQAIDIPVQESVIYAGQASVASGEFSFSFVVPKDINYQIGQGKISLYADDAGRRVDGHGYQYLPVGGADRHAPLDTIPPKIALFMDTEAFIFGGLTGQSPKLLANLSDSSGINTTGSGIGHEITAVLDHDPTKLLILNDSYVAVLNNFTKGKVTNFYKDLSVGPHSLTLKAWDTYNNSAESTLEFVVARNEQMALTHVLNYPNPFAGTTTFMFDHNREGDDLDVQVQIFTVAGQLVRTLRAAVPGSAPHQGSINWNGRDEFDDQLARGVYVYRVSVRTPRDGSTASKFEKLVILN